MKYWFDTEFQDHGRTIDLISIGVIAEDGREYYAISEEYDQTLADEWLHTHVLSQLGQGVRRNRQGIRDDIANFVGQYPAPVFWAYYGEYDWIVLRQLWGKLTDWPAGWPLLHMDIEQWRRQTGAGDFPKQADGLHNALEDARWTKASHDWLMRCSART